MYDPLQPQPTRLIYLCGLSDALKRDFCRYFRESIEDCELRVFGLEEGMHSAILRNPTFLFTYAETENHLARVASSTAFLRSKLPHIHRVLICTPRIYATRSVDQISLDGILTTGSQRSDLIACINSVGRGLRYVHPGLQRTYLETPDLPSTVTDKEEEVLQHMATGKQNKQIADLMNISPHTVKNHKSNLVEKLGLGSTTELFRYAIQHIPASLQEALPFDN